MNKYLRGTINLFVGLAFTFVGVLIAGNILTVGFLFFPDLVTRVLTVISSHSEWVILFVSGFLSCFFLLTNTGLAVFAIVIAIKWGRKFDIEKIIERLGSGHVLHNN